MAVLGGIPGGSYSQVALTGGTTSGTTTSGKTNTSTNTGTTTSSNTTTQTGNSSSSQNTSGASGAAGSGTSASNSTSNGGNTTNVTVAPSVADKTGAISLQEAEAQRVAAEEAARKAAEEAARKAAEEAARKAAEEAARKAAEAAQKAAEAAAQKAAEEAAQKAAEEAAKKAAEEAARKEQERLAWEAQQRAMAERAQREAAQKAAAEEAAKKAAEEAERQAKEEALRKSEAEEAERRAAKAEIADAARQAAAETESEEHKSFTDTVIDIFEKIKKYNDDVQAVEQQVLLEQVEMVGETMNQLWDNYMFSMEQNQAVTQATAEGINQWSKIVAGDASDLTEEQRENLHLALDVMAMLPGGGVYDWLNAELYEAEGNTKMAAACTVAAALPGAIPATKYLADKAVDVYNLSKSVDLMNLALKSGSIDELAECMIKYVYELQEAGELLLSTPNSRVLRQNLIKAGADVPSYPNAAHHIVAGNSAKAAEARAILQKYGVDINDAANGVFLPTVKDVAEGAYHPGLHTDSYYRKVTELLSSAKSKEDVLDILGDIAEQLKKGTF